MSVSSLTHTERQGPGYALTRFNAVRHGVLSRHTVLPWEDETEYQTLLEALATEHTPEGPTEEHLVEELAGVLWRTRRLRLAEAAAHRRGLEDTLAPYRETVKAALVHLDTPHESDQLADAIRMTDRDTADAIAEMEEDEAMTTRASSNCNPASETPTTRPLLCCARTRGHGGKSRSRRTRRSGRRATSRMLQTLMDC